MTKITLQPFQSPMTDILSAFTLSEEQLEFTAMPMTKVHDSFMKDTVDPIVILDGDVPVGFFALESGARVAEYTDNPAALLLTAFSIDEAQQGKGFAKAALQSLPSYVNQTYPNISEIFLGVNKRNIAAASLYIKMGFLDHGLIKKGPRGEQYILHLDL